MSHTSTIRDLFGGAIKVTTPTDLLDASKFRPIPDTQEVFTYSDANTSIIVEILQMVEQANNPQEAIKYHFDALAEDNSASISTIFEQTEVPNVRGDNTPFATILSGEQYIVKFNGQQNDQVHILMALYRVERKKVDLVVTFNVPIKAADGKGVWERGLIQAKQDFETFVKSLHIVDFGLFV
ncbi:hypothetical protein APHAL10511_007019 [Amanita phalloides]|nr:hypothetical protein APHAL10511_007019 [Amanita phalloides]